VRNPLSKEKAALTTAYVDPQTQRSLSGQIELVTRYPYLGPTPHLDRRGEPVVNRAGLQEDIIAVASANGTAEFLKAQAIQETGFIAGLSLSPSPSTSMEASSDLPHAVRQPNQQRYSAYQRHLRSGFAVSPNYRSGCRLIRHPQTVLPPRQQVRCQDELEGDVSAATRIAPAGVSIQAYRVSSRENPISVVRMPSESDTSRS
jgi:hypothetical protein